MSGSGTCRCIYKGATSVMWQVYLPHDFKHNIKMKHKLCIASWSATPPPHLPTKFKILGAHLPLRWLRASTYSALLELCKGQHRRNVRMYTTQHLLICSNEIQCTAYMYISSQSANLCTASMAIHKLPLPFDKMQQPLAALQAAFLESKPGVTTARPFFCSNYKVLCN